MSRFDDPNELELPDEFEVTVTEEHLNTAHESVKRTSPLYEYNGVYYPSHCVIAQAVQPLFQSKIIVVEPSGRVEVREHPKSGEVGFVYGELLATFEDGIEAKEIVSKFDSGSDTRVKWTKPLLPKTLKYRRVA